MDNLGISELILFGIGQTIIFIIILFQTKFRQPQNLFLLFMLIILLTLFLYYYLKIDGTITDEWFGIIQPIVFLPPALGFFYAQAVISGKFSSGKAYLIHFVAPIIFTVLFMPIALNNIFPNLFQFSFDEYNYYYVLIASELVAISFLLYPLWIIILLRQYCTTGNKDFIIQILKLKEPKYRFLNLLLVLSMFNSLIFFFEVNSGLLFGIPSQVPEILTIATLILISYLFTFLFILNPKIIHSSSSQLTSVVKINIAKENSPSDQNLDILNTLNSYMEKEKPYLDCELNMSVLSEKIGIPGYIISEIINSILKQNLFEYVNNYRVEEFKKLVQNPENNQFKLVSLAYDAGFNSKATFNRIFKNYTGQTPSEYKNSLS